MIINPFNPSLWREIKQFRDITFHESQTTGAVRIAFNRPDILNAFRPETVDDLIEALHMAHEDSSIGTIILTGNGPSKKDGQYSFSAGGDQRVRGADGYTYEDKTKTGRLHILEVQRMIRFMPKIVIAVIPGWAVGGGHSLHVVCDLTIASKEYAVFRQTDPDVSSFDGGFGSAYLARQIGQKKAREIFFLGKEYSAQEAFEMGMVNAVVNHADIENEALKWAHTINQKSPTAMRMLKYAFNMIDDGLVGQQVFAGEATRLAYHTDEAREGRNAFLEKRKADYSEAPWLF